MLAKLTRLTAAAALAAAALLAAPLAQAQTTLRFSNWIPPTHPISREVIEVWARQIDEATKGAVKIQVIPPLGGPPGHYDMVRNGTADLAFVVPSYTANRFQLTRGPEMPFYAADSTSASVAYWDLHEKQFAKAGEAQGVKVLSVWVHGPGQLFTTNRKISSIDDLKGLKIRTAGGITDEVVKALGAEPFFAPAPQSYEVLSKGVADGIVFPAESIPGFKVEKAIKHALLVPGGLYRVAHAIMMNEAKWNALPAEHKAAIERVSGRALAELAGRVWDKYDDMALTQMKAQGTEFTVASGPLLAEIRSRLGGLEGQWVQQARARGIDGTAVMRELRSKVKAP